MKAETTSQNYHTCKFTFIIRSAIHTTGFIKINYTLLACEFMIKHIYIVNFGKYTARGWILFVLYLWVRLRRSIGIFIVILKVDISATSRKLLNRNKQNTLKCYNIINKSNHYDELKVESRRFSYWSSIS